MTCSLRLVYQFFHNNTKSVNIMCLKTVNSPKNVKKLQFWARIAMQTTVARSEQANFYIKLKLEI